MGICLFFVSGCLIAYCPWAVTEKPDCNSYLNSSHCSLGGQPTEPLRRRDAPLQPAGTPALLKQNAPVLGRGVGINFSGLEQVPQELVVDLWWNWTSCALRKVPRARAAVGGRLFQVGVAAFYVFAEKCRRPFGLAEVRQGVVDVVWQVTLGLAQVLIFEVSPSRPVLKMIASPGTDLRLGATERTSTRMLFSLPMECGSSSRDPRRTP